MLRYHTGFSLDTVVEGSDQVVHYGFTSEDWFRVFLCLKYFWREGTRKTGPAGQTARKQTNGAVPPQFFTEEQLDHFDADPKAPIWNAEAQAEADADADADADLQHEHLFPLLE